MSILSIDINFFKHVELNAITLCKFLYVCVSARFLTSKLVAGKGEDGQLDPSFAVLLVQLDQLGVVDLGLASSRGDVDNNANLTIILSKRNLG